MNSILRIMSFFFLLIVFPSFSKESFDDSAKGFEEGYYIKGGQKIEGYINYTYRYLSEFVFRKELNGKKQTISADQCEGFYMGNKKFNVLRKVELRFGILNYYEPAVFGEVIIEGKLNLFKVHTQVGAGTSGYMAFNYVLEKNNSRSYQLVHPIKSKFKEQLSEYFKDTPDIAENIKNGTYTEKNIEELVKAYNEK